MRLASAIDVEARDESEWVSEEGRNNLCTSMYALPPFPVLTNLHPFRPIDRRNDRFAFIATTDALPVLCLVGRKGHLLVYLALHQSGLLQNKPTAAGKHY